MAKHVYPTLTGWVAVPPYPVFLHAEEAWDAEDPFVRDNPDLFAADPVAPLRRSVEQATAAPGEARDVHIPDDADLAGLRAEAKAAGVKVDKRWGEDRLREEIEAAGG
jgi:hypothetical protein